VNVRAELQIAALHEKIDTARDQQWSRLVELVEDQQRQLARFQSLLSTDGRRRDSDA
jgi:uncharacterized membrane protein